ncbi:MAG: ATP-binding protein, partial [Candidatus Binatia bacterium]
MGAWASVGEETGRRAPDGGDGQTFVGRHHELAELSSGLDEAFAGRGRFFLVAGEPGIGKTRLADELSTSARGRGALVCWGTCHETEGAPAYWPWVQILRSCVRELDAEQVLREMGPSASDLATIVGEVRERLPGLAPPPLLEPGQARFRLFDGVATFLKNLAVPRPLVLTLDDIQWADEASLQLLRFVSSELRVARILILGLYRQAELGRQHPLTRVVGELTVGGRILLHGLSRPQVGDFIRSTSGAEPAETLVSAVHAHTEGNPFFVSEVMRLLAAENRLNRSEETESWRLGIPLGVREVIGRRLDRLSEDCNGALAAASVIGREFGLNALSDAGDLELERLREVVTEALGANLLVEISQAPGHYRFSHELVRATLYSELSTTRRMQLHARVAEALEQTYANSLESHFAELAHHFSEAGTAAGVDRTIDYATQAGRRAMKMLAYEDAAAQYELALHGLELASGSPDEVRHYELLIGLGRARRSAGDQVRARKTFLRAGEVARRLGDAKRLGQAALRTVGGRFDISVLGGDDEAVDLLKEALSALGTKDGALRSRLLSRLAFVFQGGGDEAESARLARESLDMARRVGDPRALADALSLRYFFLCSTKGDLRERGGIASEILELAEKLGSSDLALLARDFRINVLVELGDISQADREIDIRARLAEEIRQPALQVWTPILRAIRALFDGRFAEVESLAAQALEIGRRGQIQTPNLIREVLLFRLWFEQGRVGEREASLQAAVEQATATPTFRVFLAMLYAEIGREADARREFERLAANDFADIRDMNWLTHLACLSVVCAFLQDRRRAVLLYELLRPHFSSNVVSYSIPCGGPVAHYLGLLAALMESFDDAERHFQDALEMETRMGARPFIARTEHAFAEMLLRRGRPADRDRAASPLDQALATARKLGMKGLEEKILALGAPAGSPAMAAKRSISGGDSVFVREGDYWVIAYQGRSFRLRDSKGLRYIAELLRCSGAEIHALDLCRFGEPVASGETVESPMEP